MSRLLEGLRAGDLEDLVLPMVSVDEFESKVDEDAIVFGFYVHEQAAANDLDRFIQKSPVSLLDTDISPAPDSHGYYMVFVELLQTEQTAESVDTLLGEIGALANIRKWSLQVRDRSDLVAYSRQALESALSKIQKGDAEKPVEEAVLAYLTPSLLEDAQIEAGSLVLSDGRSTHRYDIVGLQEASDWSRNNQLHNEPISFDLAMLARTRQVARMLGEGWSVYHSAGYELLQHDDSTQVLILRI